MVPIAELAKRDRPFRAADFDSVCEGLDYAGRGRAGCSFFDSRGKLTESYGYGEIRERAIELADRLSALHPRRLGTVGILGETTPEFMIAFYACQYAGLLPVPLPLNVTIGGKDHYVARLRKMMAAAKVEIALGSDELLEPLQAAADTLDTVFVGTVAVMQQLSAVGADPQPLGPDEPAYIQYSSGSTRRPRGVVVMQRALMSNVRGICQNGLQVRRGDSSVSWLPLYHDMGLVGICMTSMLTQNDSHYLSPTAFARRPLSWLEVLSETGGSIAYSPTIGYELCLRRSANRGDLDLDLSRWRVAGVGGDMVRSDVLERFAERFAPFGFAAETFLPSYGLAESTLAVSFAKLGDGIRTDTVDLERFSRTGHAAPCVSGGRGGSSKARSFVVCGQALPGHAIEIRDDADNPLPERRVGRVVVTGPSVMSGYFRDPVATSRMKTKDHWLDTGDLGYMAEGQLVITGRRKDLIIVNGRNIWPQDLEWAVERLDGLQGSRVAAFSVAGEDAAERVVVIAESRSTDPCAWDELRREIAAAVHRAAGVECTVVLAPPRSLPFTTSGKLSRAAARSLYLDGSIRDVAEQHRSAVGTMRRPSVSLAPRRASRNQPEFAFAAGE